MKKIFGCLTLGFVTAFVTFLTSDAFGQIVAYDNATNYTTWTNGENLGFGFGPWTLVSSNGGGFTGFYLGNPLSQGGITQPPGNAFGIYANGTGTNASTCFRAFSNSLLTNVVFKVQWANHGIGGTVNNRGGFALRHGNATNTTDDFDTNTRFDFYYIGGGVNSFLIEDGSGVSICNVTYQQGPLELDFILLTPDTYRLLIKDGQGVNTLAVFDNMPLAGNSGDTIDSVACYAHQTDGDQNFNNFTISSTSLLPPTIDNLQPTNGTIYAASDSPLSFNVDSEFTTISSNGIQLILNGVVETNLTFTGDETTNVGVVLNTPLQNNVVYTGTIIATDDNGNHATNNFTFNTFLATDFFVEASDYNYSSGLWNDVAQPSGSYFGAIGSNGIDYLEFDLTGTNNAFRAGDLPQVQPATDVDHDGFAANTLTPYNLAYIENGEWENYTRAMGGTNYLVFARMAGFGGSPVMALQELANLLAADSNQPLATLGTFACPQTGGPQDWTFVQLKDFFSNPVIVNFPGTNTLRMTCIGTSGSINWSYLIFVPQTNTATLTPYLSEGFPYAGASAEPDQLIHFTIANRQTSVSPGTIQLYLNGTNVSGGLSLNNNAAGTAVSYQSPTLLPPGTNTLEVIYSDGTLSQTNTWQFTVVSLPVLNPAWALPVNDAISPGFSIHITKAPDDSPAGDFTNTIAEALAQLAGTLTNSSSDTPYLNVAGGPSGNGLYTETNEINYDITGTPQGSHTFNFKTNFPYIPPSGTNNYIAMSATMYLQLAPGIYTFAVRSDDGFQVTTGPTPTSTNLTLGIFNSGRSDATPSTFDFIVQTNGLYPMQLIFFQGQYGGNIEFYSVNRTNGTPTLINDATSANSVRAWLVRTVVNPNPIPLRIQQVGGNVVLTWSNLTFSLQGAAAVTGTYTNVTGATSPYTNPITGPVGFFRLIH